MNKEKFKQVINNDIRFKPVVVRAIEDRNYGLERKTWRVWVCGPGSFDATLPTGPDLWPVGKFNKLETAEKEAAKLNKWLGDLI